jgi:hypothetical protein
MEALGASTELPHQQPTMKIDPFPEDKDVAAQVAEQLAQEVPRLQLPNVVGVELKVEIQTSPGGRHRDPRDGRDAVSSIAVLDDRCLADGSRAKRLGAHLVFVDESGFQLTPTIAATFSASSIWCRYAMSNKPGQPIEKDVRLSCSSGGSVNTSSTCGLSV